MDLTGNELASYQPMDMGPSGPSYRARQTSFLPSSKMILWFWLMTGWVIHKHESDETVKVNEDLCYYLFLYAESVTSNPIQYENLFHFPFHLACLDFSAVFSRCLLILCCVPDILFFINVKSIEYRIRPNISCCNHVIVRRVVFC